MSKKGKTERKIRRIIERKKKGKCKEKLNEWKSEWEVGKLEKRRSMKEIWEM